MRRFFTTLFFIGQMWLCGCKTPIEAQAYQVEVSAGAFIHSLQAAHPECATATTGVCEYLPRAIAAQHALADAIDVYCAGPNFNAGGHCDAPAKGTPAADQAVTKLQAALANYEQIEADLKAAIKGGSQ